MHEQTEKTIQEVLTGLNLPNLESVGLRIQGFDHIVLTEGEIQESILYALAKKDRALEEQKVRDREEFNRKFMYGHQWSYNELDYYAKWKANKLFAPKVFEFKGQGQDVYQFICCYLSQDENGFTTLAEKLKVANPSLGKGLMICGNVGIGKTWLMKLFSRNPRQCFELVNAKKISDRFLAKGDDGIQPFLEPWKYLKDDQEAFYQPFGGMCIDDMGTEELVQHYGNRRNVVGDVIEGRYNNRMCGPLLHITTNLRGPQIKTMYGDRVASRLREVMNVVYFNGEDLRK